MSLASPDGKETEEWQKSSRQRQFRRYHRDREDGNSSSNFFLIVSRFHVCGAVGGDIRLGLVMFHKASLISVAVL